MRGKITKYLLNIFGAVLMLLGCIGLWTQYPAVAIGVLLTGISLIPALYRVLPLKSQVWKWIFPTLCLLLLGVSILLIPQKSPAIAEYAGRNEPPTFVYLSKSGNRYHYDMECAGDSPRRVKLEYAEEEKITPCQHCCD